jgi:hypothetical protein
VVETAQCFQTRFQIHLLPAQRFKRLSGSGALSAALFDGAHCQFDATCCVVQFLFQGCDVRIRLDAGGAARCQFVLSDCQRLPGSCTFADQAITLVVDLRDLTLHCAERCANLHQAAASGIKRLVKRSATGDPFGATRFVRGILLPRLFQALLSAGKLGGNRFLFRVPGSALVIQIAECAILFLDLTR